MSVWVKKRKGGEERDAGEKQRSKVFISSPICFRQWFFINAHPLAHCPLTAKCVKTPPPFRLKVRAFKFWVLCLCFEIGILPNQVTNGAKSGSHGDMPSNLQDFWLTAQVVLFSATVCLESAVCFLTFSPSNTWQSCGVRMCQSCA